ncbi:MAG: DUF2330 domain-containing protein [Patescibacteria group bacterium]|jgi:hypothetical protein
MKASVQKFAFLILISIFIFPQIAAADGMIMPPPDYWVQETDQRAVVFYDQGVEHLILSISFQGNAKDFGWVVPTPSKPTVKKGSDEIFTSLEAATGSVYNYATDVFGLSGSVKQEASGVTVVETKKVDYYDVTVLSSTDKNSLAKWLQDNGYDFPASASYVLDSYIENNWYFVAMKINPESLAWADVSQQLRQGHATPVDISFTTKKLVFPMKISSITSQTQESSGLLPTYSTGRLNNGVHVGSADVLSNDSANFFNSDSGSVELWVKPDSIWSSMNLGYNSLLNVTDVNGSDVFELRHGKDSSHDNLQFITYKDGAFVAWKTSDQTPLSWDSGQWYHIAATWSLSDSPVIYINGIPQTMETSYGGSTWGMSSAKGGKLYIGQRVNDGYNSPANAVLDEVMISSEKKTDADIKSDYQSALGGQALAAATDTLFLAHFDSSLTEEVSGENIDYQNVEITPIYSASSDTVNILLYVIADGKKTLPGFSTTYANWIDKKSLENLALDDQGEALLQPSKKKYFLTKLTGNMTYSQMTEDLFFREASDTSTVGKQIASSNIGSFSSFYAVIIAGVALSIGFAVTIMVISRKSDPVVKILKKPLNK